MDCRLVTAPYNESLLRVVELVVAQHVKKPTDVGSVVSVQSTNMRAMVIFDGATVATPVKVTGHTHPVANDRVGLIRYGSDWYIESVLNRIAGPAFAGTGAESPGGTTTSATPTDLPGPMTFTFVKRWDTTPILIGHWASVYGTTALVGVTGSLAFVAAATTTYTVWDVAMLGDGVRQYPGATRRIPDATYTSALPAGTYTVRMQWHRSAGTGTANQNTDDWSSAFAIEGGV